MSLSTGVHYPVELERTGRARPRNRFAPFKLANQFLRAALRESKLTRQNQSYEKPEKTDGFHGVR